MTIFSGLLGVLLFAILAVLGLGLYFLPTIVAKQNGHPSFGGIFALNFLLGWSLLGWIGSLIWALNKPQTHGCGAERCRLRSPGLPAAGLSTAKLPAARLSATGLPATGLSATELPSHAAGVCTAAGSVRATAGVSAGAGHGARERDLFGQSSDPAADQTLS